MNLETKTDKKLNSKEKKRGRSKGSFSSSTSSSSSILNIRIQDRDVRILKYLSDMEFVSYEALKTLYFPNTKDLIMTRKRVLKLKGSGLLKTIYSIDSGKALVSITDKGKNVLEFYYPDEVVFGDPKTMRLDSILHTVKVSDIRSDIEFKNDVIKWTSERALINRFRPHKLKDYIPDGTFITEKGLYFFEYERTQKSRGRIRQRINELHRIMSETSKENSAEVYSLIVCESQSIKEKYDESILYDTFKVVLREDIEKIKL